MTFEDHRYPARIAGQSFVVTVTASALHALWGADVGPQNAAAIVGQNLDMIEDIVAQKFARGQIKDGAIVIADSDLDM